MVVLAGGYKGVEPGRISRAYCKDETTLKLAMYEADDRGEIILGYGKDEDGRYYIDFYV